MPKTKPPVLSHSKQRAVQIIAIASLLLNVGLIGGYQYLLHYNQFPLVQAEVAVRCSQPGYSRLMKQIGESSPNANKKFAAASLCFTDYDTGKPIDLDSIKPITDWSSGLPPRP